MRKILLLLVAILTISVASCDWVDTLEEIELEPDMTLVIKTDQTTLSSLESTESGYKFERKDTLDPKDNATIEKNFDKIKDWTVDSVMFVVDNIIGEETIPRYTFYIQCYNDDFYAGIILDESHWDTLRAGESHKIPYSRETSLPQIESLFELGDPIIYTVRGYLSNRVVMKFHYEIHLHLKIDVTK